MRDMRALVIVHGNVRSRIGSFIKFTVIVSDSRMGIGLGSMFGDIIPFSVTDIGGDFSKRYNRFLKLLILKATHTIESLESSPR